MRAIFRLIEGARLAWEFRLSRPLDRLLLTVIPEPAPDRFAAALRKHRTFKGPTSPSFCPIAYQAVFDSLGRPTKHEIWTRDFGLWVDRGIKKLHQAWKTAPLQHLPPEIFISAVSQAITEILLRDALIAVDRAKALNAITPGNHFHRLPQQVRIRLASGLSLTTQELAESVLEALQNILAQPILSLRKTLKSYPPEFCNDTLSRDQITNITTDLINIGTAYRSHIDLWERVRSGCWSVHRAFGKWYLRPRSDKVQVIEVSRARKQMQDEGSAHSLLSEILSGERDFPPLPRVHVTNFRIQDGYWDLDMGPMEDNMRLIEEAVIIHDNVHSWIKHLLGKEFPKSNGICGKMILDLIMAIRRLANDFHEYCISTNEVAAPLILKHTCLIKYLNKALGWSNSKIEKSIQYITHDGGIDTEFFGNPLIQFPQNRYLILTAAVSSPNLERVLDRALKKYLHNNEYKNKGYFYEEFIRKRLVTLQRAPHFARGLWKIWPHALNVHAGSDNNEIDLLLILGNTLYVGEIKCSSHPFDPNEIGQRLELAEVAARQAIDKRAFLLKNWRIFVKETNNFLPYDPSGLTINVFIIFNGSHSSGFSFSGVPVTDIGLLSSYLTSDPVVPLIRGQEGGIAITLYSDKQSFERNFDKFLAHPPIIDLYTSRIKSRILPYRHAPLLEGEVILGELATEPGGDAIRQALRAARGWQKRTSNMGKNCPVWRTPPEDLNLPIENIRLKKL